MFRFGFLGVYMQSPDGVMHVGVDTTVLSGLEKDVFEKGVSEGVNNKFPLKEFFENETTDADYLGGGGHIWAHHTGRNVSPMFTREGAAFAAAGAQRHVKGRIDIRKMMARLYMTAEAMEFYQRSEASYANAMSDEKTRLVDDISYREEYAISADGRGVLALLSDDPGTTTDVDVDSPANIPGTAFGNRFIQKDMFIGAVNPATGQLRAGIAQVQAVNQDGSDFTASAAIDAAWADNDYLVQAANASVTSVLDTSYEAAFWGLPALIDDGTNRDNYFGILRTDAPSLKSYVVAAAGAFSLDLAQRTCDVVNQKLGGEIDVMVMHHSVRREYIKLLNADRRYNGASLLRPDGGTVAMKQGDLTLGEIPVKAIRSVGLAQVYFLDTAKSGFKKYVAEEGKFEDRDGSIWRRDGSGNTARHAFEAWWYSWKQYFCTNPGYNARWDGVTGQTLVVVRAE
jgi:hypothetical protein